MSAPADPDRRRLQPNHVVDDLDGAALTRCKVDEVVAVAGRLVRHEQVGEEDVAIGWRGKLDPEMVAIDLGRSHLWPYCRAFEIFDRGEEVAIGRELSRGRLHQEIP